MTIISPRSPRAGGPRPRSGLSPAALLLLPPLLSLPGGWGAFLDGRPGAAAGAPPAAPSPLVTPAATADPAAADASESTTRAAAAAGVQTTTVVYPVGAEPYEGYLSRPAGAADGLVPGVLVAHDWMGNNAFSRARAEQLARLGYVAFALDVYGQGKRPANAQEAAQFAGQLYRHPADLLARAQAALEQLRRQPGVDPRRLGAIGFCFGGTTVLELARAGADLRAVVTFHGGLANRGAPDRARNVRARLLVLHGAADPLVSPDEVAGFMKEMNGARVPYELIAYPRAVHAFTVPEAGNDPAKGAAYDPVAAEAAYAEMRRFFGETFAGAPAPATAP